MLGEEFDRPIFKVLAKNDTGEAAGHQSGFVVPRDLDRFFPQLGDVATPLNPTPSELVRAQLFIGSQYVGEVETRYQYQTWGGTRSPERRMTGNLSPLLGEARGDDILLVQRGISNPSIYRLQLIRQNSPEYATILPSLNGERWGVLDRADPPVSELQVKAALRDETTKEAGPFVAFDDQAGVQESRTKKIARSRAFQRTLCRIYESTCAMCGLALRTASGATEAEGAHIIPRGHRGADDARNGLLLCRRHHWAFDRGLLGVHDNFEILVPQRILAIAGNESLRELVGAQLTMPLEQHLAPHADALRWHREYHGLS